jgi:hypothetical protein
VSRPAAKEPFSPGLAEKKSCAKQSKNQLLIAAPLTARSGTAVEEYRNFQ